MIISWQVTNEATGEIRTYHWVNKNFKGEYFYQSDGDVEVEILEYIQHMVRYNTLDDGDDEFWTMDTNKYSFKWHREW